MKKFLKCFLLGLFSVIIMTFTIGTLSAMIVLTILTFKEMLIAKGFLAVLAFISSLVSFIFAILMILIIGCIINNINRAIKKIR